MDEAGPDARYLGCGLAVHLAQVHFQLAPDDALRLADLAA